MKDDQLPKVQEIKITSPEDLRAILLATIEGVLEGRVNVAQGNVIASLSGELHKSIKQQWDMSVYSTENLSISAGRIIKILACADEETDDDKG